ncbi:MAG TPA: biosynthetic peptidoglycan transglycosylase [Streptosporangiaceae bacterium]|nr:biosynthetic peptidoglycan transglycosylase [Streptosporangiaceae bacterium]
MRRSERPTPGESSFPAYGQPPGSKRSVRRQRAVRTAKKTGLAAMALVLAGALAFGVLMLATPAAGNARQLALAFDRQHGAPYPGVAVPYRVATALESTEDHRFKQEPGVDPIAVLRVAYGAVTGRGDQGGATLYQQLAKMLYTPGQSSPTAEAEQIALAIKLKYAYSSPEILRLYADVAYFGHGFYGLEEASCGYFGVRPDRLSWPQAALLAGLVQGPSADDPIDHPGAGVARERHVLGRLVSVGAISKSRADAYLRIPLSTLLANAGACTA